MASFTRTIGIDYSGAQTPTASLKGLRIYMADGDAPPSPRLRSDAITYRDDSRWRRIARPSSTKQSLIHQLQNTLG